MMKLIIQGLAVLCLAVFFAGSSAMAACEALSGFKSGVVAEVVDGHTLRLDSGEVVRLTGVMAPERPLALDEAADWGWDARAQDYLAEIAVGQQIRFAKGGRERDRHDRLLAHVFVGDLWVQEQLLRAGLARAVSFSDNRACMGALYVAETEARREKSGVWADRAFDVLPPVPTQIAPFIGTFQLVEGRVQQAAQVRDKVYLNFGARWSTDFTVIINKSAWKRFDALNISLLSYEKKRVRVRGWLFEDGGPVIEVNHPEQIEAIEEDIGEGMNVE